MKLNNRVSGCLVDATDDIVTIRFSEDVSAYKDVRGVTTTMVSVQRKIKSARGQVVNVAEIIAYGKVSDISNNVMTIQSNRNDPIISKSALRECRGKESVMMIDTLR